MSKHFTPVAFTLLISLLCSQLFISCKKDGQPGPNPGGGQAKSDEDSLKYLMYQIMQVTYAEGGRNAAKGLPTYYWYNQVPQLDPFSSSYSKADDLLAAIMNYPQNTERQKIDRYSFLDRNGSLANKLQNGVVEKVQGATGDGDFGLQVAPAQDPSGKTHLMVVYADKNSPAGKRGVDRSWEITAINGNSSIIDDENQVYEAVSNSAQTTFTFRKPPDGSTETMTLNAASYNVNPVLFDSVYTVNGRKVGYFVLYTFSSVNTSSGGASPTRQVLDQVFTRFRAAGISDLVVDLRYNSGGAVSTAQYLDSMIAPASAQGKVMYNYVYNDKLTQNLGAVGLQASVKFKGTGGMGLNRVFFVVGGNTASASELTLNNLGPYMDVLLVGATTYGKPVGFFTSTISIYDADHKEKYLADLYAINFETRNAKQEGSYYSGITPDADAKDIVVPWGDLADENLQKIFNYISFGEFREAAPELRTIPEANLRIAVPGVLRSNQFNGMVDFEQKMK